MRAFYRGYPNLADRRAAQVRRLHIMREDGKFPGHSGECGTSGWTHRQSEPVILDPAPQTPPEGLEWCPHCVGRAAERYGLLAQFAHLLTAPRPTP